MRSSMLNVLVILRRSLHGPLTECDANLVPAERKGCTVIRLPLLAVAALAMGLMGTPTYAQTAQRPKNPLAPTCGCSCQSDEKVRTTSGFLISRYSSQMFFYSDSACVNSPGGKCTVFKPGGGTADGTI